MATALLGTAIGELERELERLDVLLSAAVARQRAQGRWRGEDDLRGVYVSPEHAAAVLAGRAVDSGGHAAEGVGADGESTLALIAERFGLEEFERFALLLALAPELDARYRTVFGLLNDELAQGLPTVALALDVFAGPGPHSAPLRRAFRPESALVRFRLVRLRPPVADCSLLQCGLAVDEWLIARVLGDGDGAPPDRHIRADAGLPSPGEHAPLRSVPVVLVSADQRAALDEAVAVLGRPLLRVDLAGSGDPEATLRVAACQGVLDGLAIALPGRALDDALGGLAGELAASGLPVAVTVSPERADALPEAWPRRHLAPVTVSGRRVRWQQRLAAAGVAVRAGAVESVSASHPIALERIDAAVTRLAADGAVSAGSDGHPLASADLQAAARAVARHQLAALARALPGGRSWDELVLPAAALAQLRELAAAVRDRPRVLGDWGFGGRPGGRGMHVLFSGPSGTGKTLAASVIASEAGYALYAVDLAQVVDKYLGETEKQLDRVFDEAAAAGAMLLFDEADALFGRRAEVHDARDRYANVEIAYLLQRLEAHDGVTILATNLPHHLDQAFSRRLHHRIEFALPDAPLRRMLWRAVLPAAAPLAGDLDLDLVAERFELSGGAIRNAALTAGYLAAGNGGAIGLVQIARAVARELEKAGRPATRAEFRELYPLLAGRWADDG